MMKEIWRKIKGREDYEVSNHGQVRSLKYGVRRILVTNKRLAKGYPSVSLCENGEIKECRVHRLVAEAFIPKIDDKPDVNHKDGDRTNNYIGNLEWINKKENYKHAVQRLGKDNKGEKNSQAKLNEKQVRVIRHILNIPNHLPQWKIAEIFKITQTTVSEIATGKIWKHITI